MIEFLQTWIFVRVIRASFGWGSWGLLGIALWCPVIACFLCILEVACLLVPGTLASGESTASIPETSWLSTSNIPCTTPAPLF